MTLLTKSDDGTYQATVNAATVEVEEDVWMSAFTEQARAYYDHGMSWDESQVRACGELMQAEAWISPHLDGVKINGQTYIEVFQFKVSEFVRDGLITREPVKGQGIAVKYIKEPLRSIALAELDRQCK